MLLLHYTGMTTGEAALERLKDPTSEVSCHYLVFEDGVILQMVPESRRAWHAGQSEWSGTTDINSQSIGIEIVNPGHAHGYRDFPPMQMEAVVALCRDLIARWAIVPWRVLAHSDVAPQRKMDPGERFDWRLLANAGVGLWVEPAPICAWRISSTRPTTRPAPALRLALRPALAWARSSGSSPRG